MGAGNYAFHGPETSISGKTDDCALFRTGEVADNNRRKDLVADKKRCWKISGLIIRSDYFRHNKLND